MNQPIQLSIEDYQDNKTVTFDNSKLEEEEEADNTNTSKLSNREKVLLYKKDQVDRYKQIKKSIDISSKNKAILSLKSDTLAYKINIIQISVIFSSVLITFVETINATYDIDSIISTVIPIILASYIGLILSVMRFFKFDDKKEQISKTLEEYSYIINKSRRVKNAVKYFHINENTVETWENLISNYENEVYEYLLNVRESYENILQYKELVYFKRKLLHHYVKNAFAHKNIDYVDEYWQLPHREYELNLSSWNKLYHWCCCHKKNKAYYDYLNHLEKVSINDKIQHRNSLDTDVGYQKSRPVSMIITDPPRMRKGRKLNNEKLKEIKKHFDNLHNSNDSSEPNDPSESDTSSEPDDINDLNESNDVGGLGSFGGTGGLGSFGGEGGSGGPRMSDV